MEGTKRRHPQTVPGIGRWAIPGDLIGVSCDLFAAGCFFFSLSLLHDSGSRAIAALDPEGKAAQNRKFFCVF